MNDGNGNLSGYAWGENVGWINFKPAGARVTVDTKGKFLGYAWGENIGWINFAPVGGGVTTSWQAPPDTIPPVTTATISPAPNSAGWNNSPVTVTLTAVDNAGGSGVKEIHFSINGVSQPVVSGATTSIPLNADGIYTITYYAIDNAGNTENPAHTLTVNLDKTAPTVTFGTATPFPNSAGWNNTNVSLPFTPSDNLSGVAASPVSPLILSAEGAAVTGMVTITDIAGNSATYTSPAFKIDKTPPTITVSAMKADSTPYVAGSWTNQTVTVHFTCSDSGSGIASCPLDQVFATDGITPSASGTATDKAGNVSLPASFGPIQIDKTPPTITATLSSSPNAAGWHNSNVTVTFTCSDSGSGIATCPNPVTVTTEGNGQVITGTAIDKAGNTATTSVTINLDKTPPTLTCPLNTTVFATTPAGTPSTNPGIQTFLGGFKVTDNLDKSPSATLNAPGFFLMGATPVTYTGTDAAGNVSQCLRTVTVQNPPPVFGLVGPQTVNEGQP